MSTQPARRHQSRRTCLACQKGRTRCELPDLLVPDSPTPLAPVKACHRCKALHKDCVVDDRLRKRAVKRKRIEMATTGPSEVEMNDGESGGEGTPPGSTVTPPQGSSGTAAGMIESASPQQRSIHDPRAATAPKSAQAGPSRLRARETAENSQTDTLDVLPGWLIPAQDSFSPDLPLSGLASDSGLQSSLTTPNTEAEVTKRQAISVHFHGRPLWFATVTLQRAYPDRRSVSANDKRTELDELIYGDLGEEAALAYGQLLCYHPQLPTYHKLRDEHLHSDDMGTTLLFAFTTFLCVSGLSSAADHADLLARLSHIVQSARETLLLEMPSSSLHAILAMQLLCIFAPFGTLPFTAVAGSRLEFARGQVKCARRMMTEYEGSLDPEIELLQTLAETATINEKREWEYPRRLDDACVLADQLLTAGRFMRFSLPNGSDLVHDFSAALGRLSVCERLLRQQITRRALERMRNVLEEFYLDPLRSEPPMWDKLTLEAERACTELEDCNHRIQILIDNLELSYNRGARGQDIFVDWSTMRDILWNEDAGKITRLGLLMVVSSAYLAPYSVLHPEGSSGADRVPPSLQAEQAVTNAISQSNLHHSMRQYLASRPPASRQQVLQSFVLPLIRERTDYLERLLFSSANLEDPPAGGRRIVPWHHVSSLVMCACNILMETQAAAMALTLRANLSGDIRSVQWRFLMEKAATMMWKCEPAYVSMAQRSSTHKDAAPGLTPSAMSANLVRSMMRVLRERADTLNAMARRGRPSSNGSTPATQSAQGAANISLPPPAFNVLPDTSQPLPPPAPAEDASLDWLFQSSPPDPAAADSLPWDWTSTQMFADLFGTSFQLPA